MIASNIDLNKDSKLQKLLQDYKETNKKLKKLFEFFEQLETTIEVKDEDQKK